MYLFYVSVIFYYFTIINILFIVIIIRPTAQLNSIIHTEYVSMLPMYKFWIFTQLIIVLTKPCFIFTTEFADMI